MRSGVTRFFLAPGSRSTPLVLAVADHPDTVAVMHYDERGAAFAALGYARISGKAAGWITTSGTALANGYPAVVEASVDHVPLLLLTADRPPELRATGANQTIDQVKIFGSYPRWFVDLPAPSEEVPLQHVLSTVDQAVYRANGDIPGPVHVNLMFRKPLGPEPEGRSFQSYLNPLRSWMETDEPWTRYHPQERTPAQSSIDHLAELVAGAEKGLIIASRMPCSANTAAVIDLARHLHWPLLPDIGSQLQLCAAGHPDPRILSFDHLLADEQFVEDVRPDVVLHFGAAPVSKRLLEATAVWQPAAYVLVHPAPDRIDPARVVTDRVQGGFGPVAKSLIERVPGSEGKASYHDMWQEADGLAEPAIESMLEESGQLSEPATARLLAAHVPDGWPLVIGNSMPVRDADRFSRRAEGRLPVIVNRGASGIDGLIATAAGAAAASETPSVLLLGDLAALHDLNSLQLLRQFPVIVVVLNNDGGGIFHFLPIAHQSDQFEPYFGTPHGRSFEAAAQMFDLPYTRAGTPDDFTAVFQQAIVTRSSSIIEVETGRKENVQVHERLLGRVRQALQQEPDS